MFKKEIEFEDLDGNRVKRTYYFNLSKAELAEMTIIEGEGLQDYIREIIASGRRQDRAELMRLFKDLISRSVGERSRDGQSLLKSEEIRDSFMGSDAYSEFFIELMGNTELMVQFINGIVPAAMRESQEFQTALSNTETVVAPALNEPKIKALEDYSDADLVNMDSATFAAVMQANTKGKNVPFRLLQAGMARHTAGKDD